MGRMVTTRALTGTDKKSSSILIIRTPDIRQTGMLEHSNPRTLGLAISPMYIGVEVNKQPSDIPEMILPNINTSGMVVKATINQEVM